MQALFAISGSVLCWAVLLGMRFLTRNFPRGIFLVFYYLLSICVFTVLTYRLRKVGVQYGAWVFTIVVVGTLIALELFYWVFVNPEAAAQYVTVANWLIPTIMVAVTVYLVARLVK